MFITEIFKRGISRKTVVIFVLIYVIVLIYLVLRVNLPQLEMTRTLFTCYRERTNLKMNHYYNENLYNGKLQDILDVIPQPILNRSIFFVNSTCGMNNKKQWIEFNLQHACAVESAALHHNQSEIFVLFVSPAYMNKEDPFMQALSNYKNIHFNNLNFWRFLIETPVEDVLKNNNFFYYNSLPEHMSSLIRLLTLWRWGGVYMDFVTLTLRNLMDLPENTAAWESIKTIGSGVLKFSANGTGHAILEYALNDFIENFEKGITRGDASELLTNILKKRCYFRNTTDTYQNCYGVFILPKHAFYEIPLHEWRLIFMKRYLQLLIKRLKNAYVLNAWGSHFDPEHLKLEKATVFNIFAAKNCPHVYKTALKLI